MNDVSGTEDLDPLETREWLESIDSVLRAEGPARAHFLLERLIDHTRRAGGYLPFRPNTAYVNTIAVGHEPPYPGDRALERRVEAYIRWNAMAMWCRPIASRVSTADTSRPMPPRPRFTRWASITSGARPRPIIPAI